MISRDLVLASLNHKDPIRVPLDFSGHRSSGISAMLYPKLKEALGIRSGDTYVYDMIQQLAIVEPEVLDALGVDTIEMGRAFMTQDADWKDWVLPNGAPCKIPHFIQVEKKEGHWRLYSEDMVELGVQKQSGHFFEQTHFPLMDRPIDEDDFSDLEAKIPYTIWAGIPHPGAHFPLDDEGVKILSKNAKALRESTDRAIIGLFGGNLFELPQWLYRMDNFLLYMALHPDAVLRLTEKLCEIYLKNLEKWLGAVGPYIDIIVFGDDLGGQTGPLISPRMYKTFYKPYHTKLWRRAKELADVKVMLHSCGGIEPFLQDFIDAGLDAVNPVQITSKGMEAKLLKEKYGQGITFWGGGCDTRDILRSGSPEQVAAHVKSQVETFKPQGGFVFQQVHNILSDVPVENVLAMFNAVKDL